MSIEEIINHLDVLARVGEDVEKDGRVRDINGANAAALREAIALLKSHPEAQPNEPLTLEELWEMEGKPVWAQSKKLKGLGIWIIINEVDPDLELVSFNNGTLIKLEDWRDEVAFYRRPPKED